ncbi:MAG: hypothetical protein Fur0024_3070 [Patescibacteria group bacterium]
MDLNKVMIIGNVTQEPRISQTPSGQMVATFSIATNRTWTDQNGIKQSKATFHNVIAWRKLAEIVEKYVKKGKKVYVEGELENREYVAKDGTTRKVTEITISNLILLDRGGDNNTTNSTYSTQNDNSQNQQNDEIMLDEIDLDDIPV